MLTVNPNNVNNLKILKQHNKQVQNNTQTSYLQTFKGSTPENTKSNKNKNLAIGLAIGAIGIGISAFAAIKNRELLKQKFFDIASSKKAAPFFDRMAAMIDNHWAIPTNDKFFGKVDKNYCRGIRPVTSRFYRFLKLNNGFSKEKDAQLFQNIQNQGAKLVIDLTRASKTIIKREKETAKKYGMEYINFPMTGLRPPEPEQIKQFFKIIKKANAPVYVHCIDGRDRTGIMSSIYRIIKTNDHFELVFKEEMEKYGHKVTKFPKSKEFLQKFATSPEYENLRKELAQILK